VPSESLLVTTPLLFGSVKRTISCIQHLWWQCGPIFYRLLGNNRSFKKLVPEIFMSANSSSPQGPLLLQERPPTVGPEPTINAQAAEFAPSPTRLDQQSSTIPQFNARTASVRGSLSPQPYRAERGPSSTLPIKDPWLRQVPVPESIFIIIESSSVSAQVITKSPVNKGSFNVPSGWISSKQCPASAFSKLLQDEGRQNVHCLDESVQH
jgi:hypothetical protein